MASSVGKVTSEPEPTMVLIEPAKKPTASTSSASRTDMCWHRRLTAVPDEKPPHRPRARPVRVRTRRHGALRTRHVPEHDGHLRVAREARSEVAPARLRSAHTAGAARAHARRRRHPAQGGRQHRSRARCRRRRDRARARRHRYRAPGAHVVPQRRAADRQPRTRPPTWRPDPDAPPVVRVHRTGIRTGGRPRRAAAAEATRPRRRSTISRSPTTTSCRPRR